MQPLGQQGDNGDQADEKGEKVVIRGLGDGCNELSPVQRRRDVAGPTPVPLGTLGGSVF